jgi:hypothetical protein
MPDGKNMGTVTTFIVLSQIGSISVIFLGQFSFGPSKVRATNRANLGRQLFLVNWSERLACAVTELSVHY